MPLTTAAITARIYNAIGTPVPGADLTFTLSSHQSDGGLVVPSKIKAKTGSDGSVVVNLWPNSRGDASSTYSVRVGSVAAYSMPGRAFTIYVGSDSAADLDDLIVDDADGRPLSGPVDSFNGRRGAVTLTEGDISGAGGVRVIDAIMGASDVGMPDGAVIYARGRTVAGDGAGGLFRYSATSTQTVDFGLVFGAADGTGRFFRDGWTVFGFSGEANVAWFGAKGDAPSGDVTGTENSTFFSRAMTWCSEIYAPPGRYRFDNNATDQLRVVRSIKIRGAGNYATVFAFNDDAGTTRRDLFSSDGAGAWNVEFCDFGIEGTWGRSGNWTTQRSHLCELNSIGDFSAKGMRFAYSRQMGLVVTGCRQFDVSGSTFEYIKADGCRATRYKSAQVVWSEFRFVNDDSIAIHTDDSTTPPVDVNVVVMANSITDSQGIAVLGGKKVVIQGNTITRPHCRAIYVGQEDGSEEGNTAITGISITGNVIDTLIRGKAFASVSGDLWPAIMVRGEPLDELVSGGYPGRPNSSGGINLPYPYLYTNNTDEGGGNIGIIDVNIGGNTVKRTLAPISSYSDYGFGQRYARSGPVSPAITEADLGISTDYGYASVAVYFNGTNILINGNVLGGGCHGIYLGDTIAPSECQTFMNVTVSANLITDFTTSGLFVDSLGTVKFHGNQIDGDPYHRSADRLPNGKWDTGASHIGIYVTKGGTIDAGGNTYRNVGQISAGPNIIHGAGEVMACDPVAVGYHADNIGIGVVPSPASATGGWTLIVEGGDPASPSDYGVTKSTCPPSASAQPTAGKWLAGQRVTNHAQAVLGSSGSRYVIDRWLRLTSGSGHTAGTDWIELRSLTGT